MKSHETDIIGKKELKNLAVEILSRLDQISNTASDKIKENRGVSPDSIITNSNQALDNLKKINAEQFNSLLHLSKEPAIARILVEYDNDEKDIFYVCRAMPVGSFKNLASYRAPIGRLASLDIGDDLILPNGRIAVVIDKARFDSEYSGEEWDALDTVIENELLKVITINSLRKVIRSTNVKKSEKEYSISDLIAEEEDDVNIETGLKRKLIKKISLRDQPILDKFQDDIFRLSLSTRLLILGPPGTGKTTTLIKRVGQKLDFNELKDKEKINLSKIQELSINNQSEKTNWLMFTPTRLLRMYLKEAFSREQVPASDAQISTWDDFRYTLSRNSLGILRSSFSNKGFNSTKDESHLNIIFFEKQIDFFKNFYSLHQNITFTNYQEAAIKLEDYLGLLETKECLQIDKKTEIKSQIKILLNLYKNARIQNSPLDDNQVFKILVNFQKEAESLKNILDSLQELVNKKLDEVLQKTINFYNVTHKVIYLDEIKEFLNKEASATIKVINEEDINYEEDNDQTEPKENLIGRKQSRTEYLRACKYLAYNTFIGKKLNIDSKIYRFVNFLESNLPKKNELEEIGFVEAIRKQLSYFRSPLKKYYSEINKNYRLFRKGSLQFKALKILTQSNNLIKSIDSFNKLKELQIKQVNNLNAIWFSKKDKKNIKNNQVHSLEVDVIILTHIFIAHQISKSNELNININTDPEWQFLAPLARHYRAQIYVDEATDFSPIQLKCMIGISFPGLGAFFASGDLNQRLTKWGTKSRDELNWIDKNLVTKEICTTYRQTEELCKLAEELIDIQKGDNITPKLPENFNNSITHPVLSENINNDHDLCKWISKRIIEIEKLTNFLPSIAIFVKNENEVIPISRLLRQNLSLNNIAVEPCSNGEVVGQDIHVRVFDIQHIKGLEFEAVFLADINNMENYSQADLFGKYLYVGATRAATYLGICTKSEIPKEYSKIRKHCKENWSNP